MKESSSKNWFERLYCVYIPSSSVEAAMGRIDIMKREREIELLKQVEYMKRLLKKNQITFDFKDIDSGDKGDNQGEYFDPEKEVTGDKWAAKANLHLVEVKTGEEEDNMIYKARGKLFRFRDNDWKERGIGDIKLLRNKKSNKVRFLMRQDKTLKIVANFIIQESPLCDIKEHLGSDKSFFFIANDFSDEAGVVEKFVLKFGNADHAKSFLKAFTDARDFNIALKAGKDLKWAPVMTEEEKSKKEEENKTEETKKEELKKEENPAEK